MRSSRRPPHSPVYVGDVKYKRDTGPGQQSDLYQLLAYTTATQLPRATLVYADGPPSPQTHLVAPPGIHLETRHLDLAEAPSGILAQLGRIARDIEAAAAAAHAQGAAAVAPSRAGQPFDRALPDSGQTGDRADRRRPPSAPQRCTTSFPGEREAAYHRPSRLWRTGPESVRSAHARMLGVLPRPR